ncbi:hypothetical protein ACFLVD_01100 [Chloroflexota bacterium]
MAKRKKPAVEPEQRREWLRLIEEGETPPQIAKEYNYDVRTVRKAVQWARDELERRQARTLVFRKALEDHYADLTALAEKLDAEITQSSAISPVTKSDRLWSALRQHLPRSPLWKLSDRVDSLETEVEGTEKELKEKLRKRIQTESLRLLGSEPAELGLNKEGIAGAILHRLKVPEDWGLPALKVRPYAEGQDEITYGPWNCAILPHDKAAVGQEYISSLMTEAQQLPESQNVSDRLARRRKALSDIAEELATIRLRRIVPGRCRYCPM